VSASEQPHGLQKCTCAPCAECGGTGTVWFAVDGEYLGRTRCEDTDDSQICMECDGWGITETCQHCEDRPELEAEDSDG